MLAEPADGDSLQRSTAVIAPRGWRCRQVMQAKVDGLYEQMEDIVQRNQFISVSFSWPAGQKTLMWRRVVTLNTPLSLAASSSVLNFLKAALSEV